MVVNVEPHGASYETVKPPAQLVTAQGQPIHPFKESTTHNYYQIRYEFPKETNLLLFAENLSTHQRVVIKILNQYQDLRYHMATVDERQQCQLEAIKQNRRYTPDVYIGLAPLTYLNLQKKEVCLGKIIEEPDSRFDKNVEYVLVMHWLPKSRRLDYLLDAKHTSAFMHYVELLSEAVIKMHMVDENSKENESNELDWGSCKQLRQKLNHNLSFLNRVLNVAQDEQINSYVYLKEVLTQLEKLMLQALQLQEFRDYFAERKFQQYVCRCHGDLKVANIWILASRQHNAQVSSEQVKILDAIDFNAAYCNIDILADMAMLAIDIEVRTSYHAAQHFIRHYLEGTKQENKAAKAVLSYYLVEKAMIGVIVSFIYDKHPEAGIHYLQAAERHMVELQHLEHAMWLKSIVKRIRWKHLPQQATFFLKRRVGSYIHSIVHDARIMHQ